MKETNVKSNKKWLFALLPFGIVLHFIIILAIMFGLFVLVYSCEDTSYYENTNWNVSDQEFGTRYLDYYCDKIAEIMDNNNLICTQEVTKRAEDLFIIYMYNENFTLELRFINHREFAIADYCLYYYGDGTGNSLDDYNEQRNIVNALNDFTNLTAYDAIVSENRFESLFEEARTNKNGYAGENIYFDNLIGHVKYYVYLNEDNHGYYYKMQKDDTKSISSNRYVFTGLLNPLA